ncbi:MAG: hypothetical protein HIU83_16375, partial [Proteobacteria bacterium]|nr:hypothetical protein [Pseudomonadota bacterium]
YIHTYIGSNRTSCQIPTASYGEAMAGGRDDHWLNRACAAGSGVADDGSDLTCGEEALRLAANSFCDGGV